MKNLLLILPLSLSMSVAMAQSGVDTKTNANQSLDGKSFKITLTDRVSGTTGMESDKTKAETDMNKAGTTTEKNADMTTTTTVDGTGKSSNSKGSNLNMEELSSKKMILRFNSGMLQSSALTAHGVSTCPYSVTSNAGTMVTFNANCSGASTSMGSNDIKSTDKTYGEETNSGTKSSGAVNTGDPAYKGTASTQVPPATTPPPTGTSSGTDNTTVKTGTQNSTGTVQAMWSGTVDGNTIRGNLTWTNASGQSFTYTFTGNKASQKELDAEQELGLK